MVSLPPCGRPSSLTAPVNAAPVDIESVGSSKQRGPNEAAVSHLLLRVVIETEAPIRVGQIVYQDIGQNCGALVNRDLDLARTEAKREFVLGVVIPRDRVVIQHANARAVPARRPEVAARKRRIRVEDLHAHAALGKPESVALIGLLPVEKIEVLGILVSENEADVVVIGCRVDAPCPLDLPVAEVEITEQKRRVRIEDLSD